MATKPTKGPIVAPYTLTVVSDWSVVVADVDAPWTDCDWEAPEVTEVVIVNVFVTLAPKLAK